MSVVQCVLCCPGSSKSSSVKTTTAVVQQPAEYIDDDKQGTWLADEKLKKEWSSNCENNCTHEYGQGEGIRQHLIEEHSKFVAKAFLYPDLSSSIHYWLMACVEYGTPPNDPMITQICSTTADVDTTTIAATLGLAEQPQEESGGIDGVASWPAATRPPAWRCWLRGGTRCRTTDRVCEL
ncbi:hypothetical protein Q1695_014197 [Nippostrongylus brasiliensis]|nr:hypothetical protein Q1695_014197 [Nippostrongylus brasiliensis]